MIGEWAAKGQAIKNQLLQLVDEDTRSFNGIIQAIRLPKSSEAEKATRAQAIQDATKYAIEVPFTVMQASLASFEVIKAMADFGNPNSVTDAGVGALCARAAVHGAYMNVQINAMDLEDKSFVKETLEAGQKMTEQADALEAEIRNMVQEKIKA